MESSLTNIDTSLGGPRLQQGDVAAFEESWAGFQAEFDPGGREAKETIAEIARLVDVSGRNLEQVRGQNWFLRAWGTVSGNNKRLSRINEENLLRVQKGAFYFLEGLAAQNQLMMKAVSASLQRVEDNQVQNERLKAHLLQVIRRYNDRIRGVEARQDGLERRLAAHEGAVGQERRWLPPMLVLMVGIFVFGASGILWLLALELGEANPLRGPAAAFAPWLAVCGAVFGVVGGGALVLAGRTSGARRAAVVVPDGGPQHRVHAGSPPPEAPVVVADPRVLYLERVRRENARIRMQVSRECAEALVARYAAHAAAEAGKPLAEAFAAIDSFREFGGSKPSSADVALAIDMYLGVSANVRGQIRARAGAAAGGICQHFNQLVATAAAGCQRGALGARLAAELERSQQTALGHDLDAAFDVYDDSIAAIETARMGLLSKWPRRRNLLTEHPAQLVGRKLLDILLIIPVFLDDDLKFITSFDSDFDWLKARWAGFRKIVAASKDSRIEAEIHRFVGGLSQRLDGIFDACDEEGVRLEDVRASMKAYLAVG